MLTLPQLLQKNNSSLDNADLILILAKALNKDKEFIFSHPEYKLKLIERARWYFYLNKLKHGWPVAYILKSKEFFGLNFLVNKHTLIPRPDTEVLVEEVIKTIKDKRIKNKESATLLPRQSDTKGAHNKENIILIDVGTGSGCIPISILKNIKTLDNTESPLPLSKGEAGGGLKAIAIDISNRALKIAQKNAKAHNVKINFLHGNLLDPINKNYSFFFNPYSLIIITANLPYLTSEQMNESTIKHEPKTALYGGADGLDFYKKLLEQIKTLVDSFQTKKTLMIFLEIDPDQTEKIIGLIKNTSLCHSSENQIPAFAGMTTDTHCHPLEKGDPDNFCHSEEVKRPKNPLNFICGNDKPNRSFTTPASPASGFRMTEKITVGDSCHSRESGNLNDFCHSTIEIIKDLSGLNRVVKITIN